MIPLDRALVSSYKIKLSIVTMLLTEAVWSQFAMQLFGSAVSTPVWGNGGCRGSESVPQSSGQAPLFTSSVFWQDVPFSHNTCVTKGQMDTTSYHMRDR